MDLISPYVFPILKHWMLNKKKHPYLENYRNFTIEDVKEAIIFETDAPPDFLDIKCRRRRYADAKKIYCKICTNELRVGTVELAKTICEYDHSDVIHAKRAYDNLYKSDDLFRKGCDRVKRRLGIANL